MPELCPHCGAEQPLVRVTFCPACRGDVDEPPINSANGQPIRETVDLTDCYATETQFRSRVRQSRYATQGVFVAVAEGLQFVGPKGFGFEMRRITAVRWMVPWTTFVALSVCDVLLVPVFVIMAASGGGQALGCAAISLFTLVVGNVAAAQ